MSEASSEARASISEHAEHVASLIFVADRAISVVEAMGEGVDGINGANLGDLFGTVRDALVDSALLSVAKIFERATPRYPLWNLRSLLTEIHAKADDLNVLDRPRAIAFLDTHTPPSSIGSAAPDVAVTRALVEAMLAQLPDERATIVRPHDIALDALRQQRDKVIAHNEALDRGALLSATWQDLQALLGLAKEQLGLVGWVFLSTVYVTDDGHYVLADDAARCGMAMRRLLTKAGLRPARRPGGVV